MKTAVNLSRMAVNLNNKQFLQSLLPTLRDELALSLTKDLSGEPATICHNRIVKLFDYTMAGGKFSRSSLALSTYTVSIFLNPILN